MKLATRFFSFAFIGFVTLTPAIAADRGARAGGGGGHPNKHASSGKSIHSGGDSRHNEARQRPDRPNDGPSTESRANDGAKRKPERPPQPGSGNPPSAALKDRLDRNNDGRVGPRELEYAEEVKERMKEHRHDNSNANRESKPRQPLDGNASQLSQQKPKGPPGKGKPDAHRGNSGASKQSGAKHAPKGGGGKHG